MKLNKIKSQLLKEAKPFVAKYGWNENLFNLLKKSKNNSAEYIEVLFPGGYLELLELYLNEINIKMNAESKKIDFFKLRIHERIKALIILRLKIMSNEKTLVSKTILHLLLPNNYNFALKNLYFTVDQIWYLAGDNSTDFNFYTKRIILSTIYFTTLIHFINNDNFQATVDVLNKQLKKVSKIPKIKNSIQDIIKITPHIYKFKKNFSFFKQ